MVTSKLPSKKVLVLLGCAAVVAWVFFGAMTSRLPDENAASIGATPLDANSRLIATKLTAASAAYASPFGTASSGSATVKGVAPNVFPHDPSAWKQSMRYTVEKLLQAPIHTASRFRVDAWQCDAATCSAQLSAPLVPLEGSPIGDPSLFSALFDDVKKASLASDTGVGLASLEAKEGSLRAALVFSEPGQAQNRGRFMTAADMAEMRAETIKAYLETQQQSIKP